MIKIPKNSSRTANVSRNATIGLVCQVFDTVCAFVLRTVFIKTLGADYLGVNGLFTNVLSILSFAELGIGNAIVFSMYKPLAIGDEEKIGSLMALYKKCYNTIALVVAVVGLLLIPFLKFIIKDPPDIDENLTVLYLMYLSNTVFSFLLVYRKSIIIADQRNYVVSLVFAFVKLFQVAAQVSVLFLVKNYYIYLGIQIAGTVIDNLICSFIAKKEYPYLKKKYDPLPDGEKKQIFKNIRSLAVYKFGSVILNGTDNLLVSAMVNVTSVGLVSNYVLLNNTCNTIVTKIIDAFTASAGNLNAVENDQKKYEVFRKMLFITAWLYGFVCVGLYTMSDPLIEVWIGKDYFLDQVSIVALLFGVYLKGVHNPAYTYRTTLGLFEKGRIAPLCAAIINLVLSIVLCKWVGLAGIFIATPIARALTMGVVDPILIYRNVFHVNSLKYYLEYGGYLALNISIAVLLKYAISFIPLAGIFGLIVKIAMVAIAYNLIMLLIFFRTKKFRQILNSAIYLVKSKGKKKNVS